MSVNLHSTMDAKVWVDEWMKTIKEHPEIPNDEGAMLGWFANAIMAGYDTAQQKMPPTWGKSAASDSESKPAHSGIIHKTN